MYILNTIAIISKRRLFLSFILLFIGLQASANNIDSLKNALISADLDHQLDILTSLSWSLKFIDQEEALNYALKGLSIAQKNNKLSESAALLKNLATIESIKGNKFASDNYCNRAKEIYQNLNDASGIATIFNILGLNSSNSGAYDEAISYYDKSLLLYKTLADSSRIVSIEANMANVYFLRGKYKETLPYYHRIFEYAKAQGDEEKMAINSTNLGMSYLKLSNYPSALEYLYTASELLKASNKYFLWLKNQNQIGLIYRRLGLIEESIQLYKQAIVYAEENDHQALLATLHNNLGLSIQAAGNLDEALENYEKSLALSKQLKRKNIGHIISNIGNIHLLQHNLSAAQLDYMEAIKLDTIIGADTNIALAKSGLGYVYYEQQLYSKAEKHFLGAFDHWKKSYDLDALTKVTHQLSLVYHELGQSKKSEEFKELNAMYQDSLLLKEEIFTSTRLIISKKIKEYESNISKNEQAIERLENEKRSIYEKLKGIITYGLLILLLFSIGILLFIRRMKKNKGNLEATLESIKNDNASLKSTIEHQNKEMTLISLDNIHKEKTLKTLSQNLVKMADENPQIVSMRKSVNELKISDINYQDWSLFRDLFNRTFPDFLLKLRNLHPNLSKKDIQHIMLIKLHTPPMEVGKILGISTESVHTARYRIRKKLQLKRTTKLEDHILNIEL